MSVGGRFSRGDQEGNTRKTTGETAFGAKGVPGKGLLMRGPVFYAGKGRHGVWKRRVLKERPDRRSFPSTASLLLLFINKEDQGSACGLIENMVSITDA
jgi:hypothetical protein